MSQKLLGGVTHFFLLLPDCIGASVSPWTLIISLVRAFPVVTRHWQEDWQLSPLAAPLNLLMLETTRGKMMPYTPIGSVMGPIVAGENYKHRDENPEDQRIFPSEALWQSFLLARGQRPSFRKPMRLCAVVRSNVVNASSRTAIWHAARRSTSSNEGPKGYKVYTELDDGFNAILGSQNGASTMRLLLDHKAPIGFRTVEKIAVFECRNAGDEEIEDLARNFAVILSDPRRKGYRTIPSRIPRLVSRKL